MRKSYTIFALVLYRGWAYLSAVSFICQLTIIGLYVPSYMLTVTLTYTTTVQLVRLRSSRLHDYPLFKGYKPTLISAV